MNKNKIISRLRNLKIAFEAGKIPTLKQHEVNPGLPLNSRENYLYFMMTCSINFQRSSPKTWEAALNTWNDTETRFVFFPEEVVKTSEDKLRKSLLKHKLALQPNKHIQIWSKISNTFNSEFKNDPRELFVKGDHDAAKILNIMQKEMKPSFPYLSGLKLSNYSLFILIKYTDLKLKNTHQISIIPDTHIMQATTVLGLLEKEKVNPKNVEDVWRDLLEESEFSPIDFHSILWNWSRNNFVPKV